MTSEQLNHLETQLLRVIDCICEKESITLAELEALSKVTLSLAEIGKL